MDTKLCHKCGQIKPLSEFYNCRATKDGHKTTCKTCDLAYAHQYRKNNRDRLVAYMRQWHAENREHSREYGRTRPRDPEQRRANRAKHRDHEREYSRQYRLRNRAKYLVAQENWRKANGEYSRAYRQSHRSENATRGRNRRARIREIGGVHTVEDIQAQYQRQNGKCYYCGKKLGKKYHVDHVIPIARGGSNDPSNLVIACAKCNQSKQDKLPHEWPDGGRLL